MSWVRSQMYAFLPPRHDEEPRISPWHHNLKAVMIALLHVFPSSYWESSFWIRNPGFAFLLTIQIHPRTDPSEPFVWLYPSLCILNQLSIIFQVASKQLLHERMLSRLCISAFFVERAAVVVYNSIPNLWILFSLRIFFQRNIDLTRSKLICKSSTKNYWCSATTPHTLTRIAKPS